MLSYPSAPDTDTNMRWQESRLRRRLLEGTWLEDLQRKMAEEIDASRAAIWRTPDLTKNILRSIVNQLSILYDRAPIVTHSDPEAAEAMRQLVNGAGLWQLDANNQRLCIAQRESAIRVDFVGDPGRLLYRVIPADLLWAKADPDAPDEPVTIWEYRQRIDPDGEMIWTRDMMSIDGEPYYMVQDEDGRDLTEYYLGGDFSGENYPYRLEDGTPILPYAFYHARRTGRLWNAWEGSELVAGTLKTAVNWTFFGHVLRDCSWPQRYFINCEVLGLRGDQVSGEARITTDPASVLNLGPRDPGTTATAGQFKPGGDPEVIGRSIRDYSADMAADFDITPADIQRSSGDARSGYAIYLTREGQRQAQRRFEPQFRRGDEALLAATAVLMNRLAGASLPETGWGLTYTGLPLSIEERKNLIQDYEKRVELGIMSKVQLLSALDGITEDQAAQKLIEMNIETTVQALNGAQVSSMVEVAEKVALGVLTPAAAVEIIIVSFGISREQAESIISNIAANSITKEQT